MSPVLLSLTKKRKGRLQLKVGFNDRAEKVSAVAAAASVPT
jgi:hypothetical protein